MVDQIIPAATPRKTRRPRQAPMGTFRPAIPEITPNEAAVITAALSILTTRLRLPGELCNEPRRVKDYLTLRLADHDREAFAVLFLDAQHQLILCEEMFQGTLTQTTVYPREVVKRALELNAASVIVSHNHPSGAAEPSRADEFLTSTLKTALSMVDVRLLDHKKA